MPLLASKNDLAMGAWVERTDRRRTAKRRDLGCVAAQRRRALGILLLIRNGVEPLDIAEWFHLTPQRVGQIARKAEAFGRAVIEAKRVALENYDG